MPNTTDDAATMSPPTRQCPHCGRRLPCSPLTVGGRVWDWIAEPCGCEEARRERESARLARLELERRREYRRRRLRYSMAGIAPRYREAEDPRAADVLADVRDGTGAYITGPVGTGKTHLASAVARLAVDAGMRVRMVGTPALLADIKATFGSSASEDDVLAPLLGADLLLVDDLGKESPTPWALQQLFRLVDARYASCCPVVVTTQYSFSALIGRLGSGGDVETATAIASRLKETCRRVELAGRDRRLSAARAGRDE